MAEGPAEPRAALARDAGLARACIETALHGHDGPVAEAMRYAVAGGKGLRAVLVMEGALLFGIDRARSAPAAAAIEAVHAYSLIHDDLPCMDDDDLRRGKPTVHRHWDEATAVLGGDALQALAFELLCDTDCPDAARLALLRGLARAAGVGGMVGGQAQDIAAESAATPLTLDEITGLQAGKTGALICWAATAGAVMAEAPAARIRALQSYGDCLGLAFQIADDILDVEGDAGLTGKAVGKDAAAGKATFVSLLGLDAARTRAAHLVDTACDALSVFGDEAQTLQALARFVISRQS
ncbi:polyprenyl synthetase family protein [Roseovarius ramblicola]|uniref:Polyprenyl synthetase family protein n=1 Tax=Roseovarius ramblicola TaxID=2022336 RepID=A0ABV5I1X5_9RHOB